MTQAMERDPLLDLAPDVQVPERTGYALFDADNHYYEALDALTRHLPKAYSARGPKWAEIKGRSRLLVGEKIYGMIPNPTFDPIAKPGCMHDYFSCNLEREGASPREFMGELEPIRPEYRDRDARLKVMDEQGVAATVMFPTLAVGLEVAFQPDIEAMLATFTAFNRWLDEDWGFNHQGRIYAAPIISLSSPDWAVAELERVLERGARVVTMRNGPVYTASGTSSPAAPQYDRFWGLAEEAGVLVAPHAGDDGYDFLAKMWEPGASFQFLFNSPMKKLVASQRAVPDFFGALICHRLFERFPRLRVASVENGGSWIPDMLRRLYRGHVQDPCYYRKNPVDVFHEHIWVTPFFEDNAEDLLRHMPVERMLFGSDWPHVEGVAQPIDFLDTIATLGAADQRKVMRENIAEAMGLAA